MTPDTIFSIANSVALLSWILLAAFPSKRWANELVPSRLVPCILGSTYIAILAAHWGEGGGGFGTLSAVAQLFSNRWALLGGWIHYLAFDLFVGAWEVRDARRLGVHRILVLPCLVLTFLFGPTGLLLYLGLRGTPKQN
jgi:hypothetical protein